jgi:hypothetical protein
MDNIDETLVCIGNLKNAYKSLEGIQDTENKLKR